MLIPSCFVILSLANPVMRERDPATSLCFAQDDNAKDTSHLSRRKDRRHASATRHIG